MARSYPAQEGIDGDVPEAVSDDLTRLRAALGG